MEYWSWGWLDAKEQTREKGPVPAHPPQGEFPYLQTQQF